MKKFLRKAKVIGELFGKGVAMQFESDSAMALAGVVGLYQGLKYRGSLARGVKASVAVVAVLGTVDGIRMVIKNREFIKSA